MKADPSEREQLNQLAALLGAHASGMQSLKRHQAAAYQQVLLRLLNPLPQIKSDADQKKLSIVMEYIVRSGLAPHGQAKIVRALVAQKYSVGDMTVATFTAELRSQATALLEGLRLDRYPTLEWKAFLQQHLNEWIEPRDS